MIRGLSLMILLTVPASVAAQQMPTEQVLGREAMDEPEASLPQSIFEPHFRQVVSQIDACADSASPRDCFSDSFENCLKSLSTEARTACALVFETGWSTALMNEYQKLEEPARLVGPQVGSDDLDAILFDLSREARELTDQACGVIGEPIEQDETLGDQMLCRSRAHLDRLIFYRDILESRAAPDQPVMPAKR